MSGRGEGGRGRAGPSGAGRGLGLAGRGRGLRAQPPAPSPVPSETPSAPDTPPTVKPSGRGLAPSAGPPSAFPSVPRVGRGRGFAQKQQTHASAASSIEASPAASSSAAPAASSSVAPAASSSVAPAASSSAPPPAPVVSLGVDLADINLALPDIPLYKRPAKGTRGREIALESNLFKIELKNMTWYKYDVEISTSLESKVELKTAGKPNRDKIQSRALNREIIAELFRKHHKELEGHWPAYDGRKTLICAKKFFDTHVFTVDLVANERGRSKQFIVKLRCTLDIDVGQVQMFYENRTCPLNPEVLQAANIVIDSSLGRNYVAVNRAYYATDRTLRNSPLTGGKELRSGIYTSMVFAEWKPLLVVDKSNTAFYKAGDLIAYISDFINDERRNFLNVGFSRDKHLLLSRDFKGVVVRLKHAKNRRCVKVSGLSPSSANETEFRLSDGTLTNVAAYFNERYGPEFGLLKYPNLPCAVVVRANGTKTDYYPLEVCEIKEDQPYRRKLNPLQTSKMIKECQEPPHQRIQKAVANVRTILRDSSRVLSQHGVTISEKPITTTGRQIESPAIRVKDQTIPVREGRWTQYEFHEGAKLGQWCVLDCAGVGQLKVQLAKSIERLSQKMRLQQVGEPLRILDCKGKSVHDIFKNVKTFHNAAKGPMMAVMILGLEPIYAQIKRLSETTKEYADIITQCVKAENLQNQKKFNDTFVNNLLKKMNVKLGGINNAIASIPKRFKDETFIVIGADVSHPGVGDLMTPSIAAIVGSLDYIPSKYWTEVRVQTNENNNRIEYIKDLKEVARILLIEHRAHTRQPPAHIYYIRDGVSEGQFEEVRRREIGALRDACRSMGNGEYRPNMTVLIAQKRHHTRFNVINRNDGTRSGNIPPGTYIDRDVVHPVNFDLYMYSHQGLLGTSRPTHYHLIHSDDKTFTTDDITEIIYHLCHCYARTTSSVSIPAPIYYAHLAAFRAKEHVKGDPDLALSDSRSMSSGGDGVVANLSEYQATCSVNPRFRNRLYYA